MFSIKSDRLSIYPWRSAGNCCNCCKTSAFAGATLFAFCTLTPSCTQCLDALQKQKSSFIRTIWEILSETYYFGWSSPEQFIFFVLLSWSGPRSYTFTWVWGLLTHQQYVQLRCHAECFLTAFLKWRYHGRWSLMKSTSTSCTLQQRIIALQHCRECGNVLLQLMVSLRYS